jgi:hypothetical protein
MLHASPMLSCDPEALEIEQRHHVLGWLMWLILPAVLVGSTVLSLANMG